MHDLPAIYGQWAWFFVFDDCDVISDSYFYPLMWTARVCNSLQPRCVRGDGSECKIRDESKPVSTIETHVLITHHGIDCEN